MSEVIKIFVKPAKEEVLVRNPERNRHLKVAGEFVTKDAYWFRRIQDGDVNEIKGDALKALLKKIADAKAKAKKEAKVIEEASAKTATNPEKN